MPKFSDIPQLTPTGNYTVTVGWQFLEEHLASHLKDFKLDLEPDFQRGHVWTEAQQIAYVEYILRGGRSGREIYFNCPGWARMTKQMGQYVIVDGLQRLTAVRRFLRDEIPAFGHLRSTYTDNMRITGPQFTWCVNDLPEREQVLQWYLEMNSGGTPHTEKELKRVQKLREWVLRKKALQAIPADTPCEQCGSTVGVHVGYKPYEDDVHNEKIPVRWCQKCFDKDAFEI